MEGLDLSAMTRTWQDLAASEMRLQLMTELGKINVGFADVEEFNLGIERNLKSKSRSKNSEMQDKGIIRAAMTLKMRDEQRYNSEMTRKRNIHRRDLGIHLGQNSKKYRTTIRNLRNEAFKVKKIYREDGRN